MMSETWLLPGRRCNIKKGRKAGIWIVKAIVGKHEIYWMIRRLLQLALLALIAYLAVSCHLPGADSIFDSGSPSLNQAGSFQTCLTLSRENPAFL